MNDMYLLHIVENLAGSHGGSTSAAFAIANLPCRRLRPMILGLDFGGKITSYVSPDLVVKRVTARPGKLGKFLGMVKLVSWVIFNRHRIGVIEFHNVFNPLFLVGGAISILLSIPVVLNPHNSLDEWDLRKRYWLKRLIGYLHLGSLLSSCALVRCATRREQQRLVSFGYKTRITWALLPIAVESGVHTSQMVKGPGLRVLFCSRIDRKKRVDLILRAVSITIQRGTRVELTVAGTGDTDYMAEMFKLADNLGIGTLVQWVGFVSGVEKSKQFQCADVFILPSLYENFGIVVIEAICNGLRPVLTPNVFIADHLPVDCRALIISDVEGLVKVLEDVNLDRALGRLPPSATESVRDLLFGGAGAERILGLYDGLLDEVQKETI